MNVWEIATLRSVNARGGRATNQEIYSELESGKFITLTERDLRKSVHGDYLAYQDQVRSHLSNLTQAGDVQRVTRGNYVLTKRGRRRIERK